MDRTAGHKSAEQFLYPAIGPYDHRMLDVGDGHKIYVEQCGNPDGIPVVVLHGGPGGGCSPAMRRYFDPKAYRIILFDQRGCGKSRPHASVETNTTWHLVADIELIRETFGIDKWVVFGGSWGATLSLIYAQSHPTRVSNIVVRGIFLMTQRELKWFYGGGAGRFWPELWERFTSLIPRAEHGDLITAYHERLFSGSPSQQVKYARAWTAWENALASVSSDGRSYSSPAQYALAFSRLENHYFFNAGFLGEDGKILRDMENIAHIPGVIVQGRLDMICPPETAQALHDHWPESELHMIPRAGHAMSEPGITSRLLQATDAIAMAHLQK